MSSPAPSINRSLQESARAPTRRLPIDEEDTRQRAYEIYLSREDVAGNELDDWLQAEREIQSLANLATMWKPRSSKREPSSSLKNGVLLQL